MVGIARDTEFLTVDELIKRLNKVSVMYGGFCHVTGYECMQIDENTVNYHQRIKFLEERLIAKEAKIELLEAEVKRLNMIRF